MQVWDGNSAGGGAGKVSQKARAENRFNPRITLDIHCEYRTNIEHIIKGLYRALEIALLRDSRPWTHARNSSPCGQHT